MSSTVLHPFEPDPRDAVEKAKEAIAQAIREDELAFLTAMERACQAAEAVREWPGAHVGVSEIAFRTALSLNQAISTVRLLLNREGR